METAYAVSIYPNYININGKPGERAPIQLKVYGHPVSAEIEIVKAKDLKEDADVVIKRLDLGAEQQMMVPLTIVVPDVSTEYYLCAVLRRSQSMRLRVCSAVHVTVKP